MKKRIISAVILLAIVIPLIILGGIPFALGIGLVGVIAFLEIMKLYNYPVLVKALSFISFILITYNNFDINNISLGLDFKYLCLSLLLTLTPIIFYQVEGKYTTKDAFKLYGFILLVSLGLNFFIVIRNLNIKYFLLVFLIPVFTDTFAYTAGSLIGKHKATKLSPKKSWEGYIVGSVMATFIMTMYYNTFINVNENIFLVALIILIMSVFAQIGDLFFSAIKRNNDIKDFSNLIPGHGGILDRLDSLIFTALTFMVFINFL